MVLERRSLWFVPPPWSFHQSQTAKIHSIYQSWSILTHRNKAPGLPSDIHDIASRHPITSSFLFVVVSSLDRLDHYVYWSIFLGLPPYHITKLEHLSLPCYKGTILYDISIGSIQPFILEHHHLFTCFWHSVFAVTPRHCSHSKTYLLAWIFLAICIRSLISLLILSITVIFECLGSSL